MAITKLNSLAIPPDTIVESDLSYPLTNFSSTGIDDNATSTAITIDSSENVGVGDTAPDVKLKIKGGTGTIEPQVTIEATAFNAGQGTALNFSRAGFDQPIQARISAVDNGAAGSNFIFSTKVDGTAGALTERMRIDSSGNVGIGTSTFNLDTFSDPTLAVGSGASGTRGTVEIAADITTNTAYGILAFTNDSSTDTTNNKRVAQISASRNGNNNAADLHFLTNSGSSYDSRMIIDSSGNLLVGRTSTPAISNSFDMGFRKDVGSLIINSASSTGPLQLNQTTGDNATRNQIRFFRNENLIGQITSNTVEVFYNTTSDQRLKENIVDAPAGNIDTVRVRSFDWKVDGSHQTYGMVAQELVEVAPYATHYNEEEDQWSVDYSKLVPMMIKEIQDLKAEVAALKGA